MTVPISVKMADGSIKRWEPEYATVTVGKSDLNICRFATGYLKIESVVIEERM